jgi:hypothetical protein
MRTFLRNPQRALSYLNYEANTLNIKFIELYKITFNHYVISDINILVYFNFLLSKYLR